MKRPSKPKKNVDTEAKRANVLLEKIDSNVSLIAENQRTLGSELDTVKRAIGDVDERLGRLEPIVNSLAHVPKKLESLEDTIDRIEKRLEATEARLPA